MEQNIYESLGSEADGYIARYDRAVSIPLSKFLVRTPITPNQITTASLAVTLYGAWMLSNPRHFQSLTGAALLWVGCILDGCDGEVARLKHLTSKQGAVYDVAADHIGHAATFAAILLHIRRGFPGMSWTLPAILLASGVLACMWTVWKWILSRPSSERSRAALAFERIASRDYVYLILLLTIIGRLDLFLWSAAVGSHLFWLGLWWVS